MIYSQASRKMVKYLRRPNLKREPRRLDDLSGKQIGNFFVIGLSGRGARGTKWNCRCICGREVCLWRGALQNMLTCGCGRVQLKNDDRRVANRLLRYARWRATARKHDFNLTLSDIVIPENCPLLGVPIDLSAPRNSPNLPSIDRKDSSKGYVRGNVWVISNRANVLKNDATLAEISLLVESWKKICQMN